MGFIMWALRILGSHSHTNTRKSTRHQTQMELSIVAKLFVCEEGVATLNIYLYSEHGKICADSNHACQIQITCGCEWPSKWPTALFVMRCYHTHSTHNHMICCWSVCIPVHVHSWQPPPPFPVETCKVEICDTTSSAWTIKGLFHKLVLYYVFDAHMKCLCISLCILRHRCMRRRLSNISIRAMSTNRVWCESKWALDWHWSHILIKSDYLISIHWLFVGASIEQEIIFFSRKIQCKFWFCSFHVNEHITSCKRVPASIRSVWCFCILITQPNQMRKSIFAYAKAATIRRRALPAKRTMLLILCKWFQFVVWNRIPFKWTFSHNFV